MPINSFSYIFKKAQADVKHCYYLGCKQLPIRSHSISEQRVLSEISENGEVLTLDKFSLQSKALVPAGIKQASTVKCFCCEHDQKIFAPIDNKDYVIGDKEQEFLFAFRAAAREFLVKEAAVQTCDHWKKPEHYGNNRAAVAFIDDLNKGQMLSIKDQSETRCVFMDTYQKQKFNAIRTVSVTLDGWHPVAASSSFCIEVDFDGNLVNDVLESGYNTKVKPCFLTIFPQKDKTYCLISYFNHDRKTYNFLNDINNKDNQEKGIIVSNLLVGYAENVAIGPSFGQTFVNKEAFFAVRATSLIPHTSLVEDSGLNLFV